MPTVLDRPFGTARGLGWIVTFSCILLTGARAFAGPPTIATPAPDPLRSAASRPIAAPSDNVITFAVPVRLRALNIDPTYDDFVRYGPVVRAVVGCAVTENTMTHLDISIATPIVGDVFTTSDVRDALAGHLMGPAFKAIGQTAVPIDASGNYDGPPIEVRTGPIPASAIPRGWVCAIVAVREKNGARTRTVFAHNVGSNGRTTSPDYYDATTLRTLQFGVVRP